MTCTIPILFDYTYFVSQFPAFGNATLFPLSTLQMYFNNATFYVSSKTNFGALHCESRTYAVNLMAAHLVAISVIVADGQVPGIIDSATIDKLSVSLMDPPVTSEWQWWLCTTPYGQSLLALLQNRSTGGFFVGGYPALAGFIQGGLGRGGWGYGQW